MTDGTRYRGEGRVDKQNGGKGQKAYCVIELEALPSGAGFVFVSVQIAAGAPKIAAKPSW